MILKKYSWEEVQQHKYPHDCWVVVERKVEGCKKGLILDVTDWVYEEYDPPVLLIVLFRYPSIQGAILSMMGLEET